MEQAKKRYREIDVLKGVAIAMVMLGHSIIEFPVKLSDIAWCNYLHWFISSAHMPLFFAISGFCFSFRGWKGYLGKKCRRILVPYLVFSVLGVLAKVLAPSVVNGSADLGRLAITILTGGSNWFLYTLFGIFLFFPLIRKCFETDGAGLPCLAFLALLQLLAFWPELFNIDNIVRYSFFFALGYFCKCLSVRAPAAAAKLLRVVRHPLTILLCLAAWALLTPVRIRLDEEAAQTVQRLFSIDALVALAAALVGIPALVGLTLWFTQTRASRLFETAGQDSLQIYLFNGYLLTATRWLVVTKLHVQTPILVISANFFVMFFVSLWIIELIVKRVKLFRTLTGMV